MTMGSDNSDGAGGYCRADGVDNEDTGTALARDRTDMAEDRTIMAVERTFAGWIRTAFASIAIGLGFRALFGAFDPPYLAKIIATAFIVLAIFVAWTAQARACRSFAKMSDHAVDRPDGRSLRLIAYAVCVGAAILVVGLWLLNDGSLADV